MSRAFGFRVLFLALACGVPCAPSLAATATTTFEVTANVQVTCSIFATNMNFGDYISAELNGRSQISLKCTNTAQWNVGLNQGTFPGATVESRRMTGPGASSLKYGLFSNPARTINWGDTVGTDTVSGTGTGGLQIITVYGRVPGHQSVVPGGYVDTITATITF